MKKRTALLAALVSLLPMVQLLVIGTGSVLMSAGVILSVPKRVKAESESFFGGADDFYKRGNAKYRAGDYMGAIADLSKAIEILPKYTKAYLRRGNAKFAIRDYRGAIADFNKAIEVRYLYESLESVYNDRGLAKEYLGDYTGAITDFSKAIENERHPDSLSGLYSNRGNAKSSIRDYRGAIADFNKAIEIDPWDEAAYVNRARVKEIQGRMRGACSDLRKAQSLIGDDSYEELIRYKCDNKWFLF